jgi:hypothetical protein
MADQDQAEKQIDSVTDYVEEKEDTNLQSGLSSLVAASAENRSDPLSAFVLSSVSSPARLRLRSQEMTSS